MAEPVGGREVGRPPAVRRKQPDVSSVPGPRSSIASKRRSVSRVRGVGQDRHPLVPGRRRIGLVEPEHVLELPPEPLERLVVGSSG